MSAELQQRIERLEKERWIYLGLGALAVLAGLLGALLGSGITGKGGGGLKGQNLELRAVAGEESFVLKDTSGKVAYSVGVGKDGLPHMHFYDQKGKPRQSLGFSSGAEPEIRLADEKGELLVHLVAKDTTSAQLSFRDGQAVRESIGLIGGNPKLEIYDFSGRKAIYTAPMIGGSAPAAGPPK
jgi:hypothetical protein